MSESAAAGWHASFGTSGYADVHEAQRRCVEARAAGRVPDLLLTGEHLPVVTLGRKTPPAFPGAGGIDVVTVERGGEATYHGPGQLVAYPIVHLTEARRDLHAWQRDLEEIGLRTCEEFGVEAARIAGKTGVWVGARKVMSLGVAVRRWVSWHGLALNVRNDLEPFRRFHPCGLDGSVMTSLAEVLGADVAVERVRDALVRHAAAVLRRDAFETRAWSDVLAAVARAETA